MTSPVNKYTLLQSSGPLVNKAGHRAMGPESAILLIKSIWEHGFRSAVIGLAWTVSPPNRQPALETCHTEELRKCSMDEQTDMKERGLSGRSKGMGRSWECSSCPFSSGWGSRNPSPSLEVWEIGNECLRGPTPSRYQALFCHVLPREVKSTSSSSLGKAIFS